MKKPFRALALLATMFLSASSCSEDSKDLVDLVIRPPERREINQDKTGVNNFFVNPQFGTIPQQFSEIRTTLGLRFVRVLFAWSTEVQPTPNAEPDYSFYDEIISNIPAGTDVLIVLAHTPSWMLDAPNWDDGDPRKTWVRRWLRPTVNRYAGNPKIIGWEVWNEPDSVTVTSDAALQLTDPANYFQLLDRSSQAIRQLDPTKLVVIAASTSIHQNFPTNLDYNKELFNLGAENLVDIWNIHYYGEQFENVVRPEGVADFLNQLRIPIWVTESGIQGPSNQLAYVETAWPFLEEEISNIDRFYYYEYGSPVALGQNFGLRTTDPSAPVSDLYIYLRDN